MQLLAFYKFILHKANKNVLDSDLFIYINNFKNLREVQFKDLLYMEISVYIIWYWSRKQI